LVFKSINNESLLGFLKISYLSLSSISIVRNSKYEKSITDSRRELSEERKKERKKKGRKESPFYSYRRCMCEMMKLDNV